ncbi:Rv1355c family protein [Rhodococcus pyridinivorans]|uniref:Rv1355c family protein n=1 Tax=Rhodococcus pyridinivorans TaxID=103816 RepID=UPI0020C5F578|nr:Rv1355c family protein [Rhodococcus pyridinivorans]UTM38255.1 Rv1355c family protein [Rhodococcus pyridinivorans]
MSAGPRRDDGSGETVYRAVLLAEDREADMEELHRLRGEGVAVRDRLDEQLAGLARLGDGTTKEAPRWAYYPWRRTVVRVLGPEGFERLRLDRNRNKITESEQVRLRAATAGVVGLSVGHAVAYTLALEGACGALRLADFDTLELSNLNRIPVSVLDLGTNKAVLAARRIAELDPYLPVEVWSEGVTPESVDAFLDGLDVAVDECDSLDVKLLIRIAAARRRVPVVMHTSDRGLLDVERFDIDERPPFHGLLGDLDPEVLATLSNRAKVPYVLRILGAEQISTRLAASLLEVGETLEAWPQLGSDVGLGGVMVATAVRAMVLGDPIGSGRCRIDLDLRLVLPEVPVQATVEPDAVSQGKPVVDDPMTAIVDAAIRAPSGGNAQPWSILVESDSAVFALAHDPEPVLMDLHRRGSWVALGAALHNARVAAAVHGVLGGHTFLAEDDDIGPGVPVMRFELGIGTDPDLAAQYDTMLARGTNRYPSDGYAITDGQISALYTAAELVQGQIRLVTAPDEIGAIAEILAESDRLRYLTPSLRTELIRELRWPGDPDPDSGIEVASLGLDTAEEAMLDVVLRHDALDRLREWDLGGGLGRITRDRVLGSPGVLAVFAEGASPADYVRAGAAVESVWIAAQRQGLAVHPVSPIFLYADSCEDLARLCPERVDDLGALQKDLAAVLQVDGDRRVALLMRLGRAPVGTPRSRRRTDRVRDVTAAGGTTTC